MKRIAKIVKFILQFARFRYNVEALKKIKKDGPILLSAKKTCDLENSKKL